KPAPEVKRARRLAQSPQGIFARVVGFPYVADECFDAPLQPLVPLLVRPVILVPQAVKPGLQISTGARAGTRVEGDALFGDLVQQAPLGVGVGGPVVAARDRVAAGAAAYVGGADVDDGPLLRPRIHLGTAPQSLPAVPADEELLEVVGGVAGRET